MKIGLRKEKVRVPKINKIQMVELDSASTNIPVGYNGQEKSIKITLLDTEHKKAEALLRLQQKRFIV